MPDARGWPTSCCRTRASSAVLDGVAAERWQGEREADAARLSRLLAGFADGRHPGLEPASPPGPDRRGDRRRRQPGADRPAPGRARRRCRTRGWRRRGATFANGSPTSAALSFELQRRARGMSLADVFRLEYQAAVGCSVHHDFAEGVRALLVDKDRNPRWQPADARRGRPGADRRPPAAALRRAASPERPTLSDPPEGSSMATVMTVTGPISADQLGYTLMHEHLFLDLTKDTWTNNNFLSDPDLTAIELERYKQAGGVTLVDQTNRGLGQDPRAVKADGRALRPERHPRVRLVPRAVLRAVPVPLEDEPGRRADDPRHHRGDRRHRRPGRDHRRDRRALPVDLAGRGADPAGGRPRPQADRRDA